MAPTLTAAADSNGNTHMLTSTTKTSPAQNFVTDLIVLNRQSLMDSLKDWSLSTFKCTKQLINEKRGLCSITNDAQLQSDIEQLRENRIKLIQMLRTAQQMNSHYTQLVKTQTQLHGLMNEMSMKCFIDHSSSSSNGTMSATSNNNTNNIAKQTSGKHIVAKFSSLSNNFSSTTTTNSTHPIQTTRTESEPLVNDFLPILNHIRSSNINLSEDFKTNAMAINATIKNGEKLVSALNFFCSNLSTLINKTIEDTLSTVKQFEAARLEYDAERNSFNFTSPSPQTSITYSSDKLELARLRYEQLREDVQIKLRFLEGNTIKVMHKQLLLFNSAFASYSSGNTAALDSTLKQFSIKHN